MKYPEITIILKEEGDETGKIIGQRSTSLGDVAEQELQSLKDEGEKYINTENLQNDELYQSLNSEGEEQNNNK